MWRATSCWSTKTKFRSNSTIPRARRRCSQGDVDARSAAVDEAEQNMRVAQSAVEQANQRITQADASIESALTAPQQVAVSEARAKSAAGAGGADEERCVDQAKLNLSYCTIVAPVTGIVGKKTVELGQNISPGQQLMAWFRSTTSGSRRISRRRS